MSDLKLDLRAGIWQVTGTVKVPGRAQGVRVRESTGFTRRRDAETYRDKLRQEVIEREIHGSGYSLTFAECCLIYLEKGGEKRFMSTILEHFGPMRIRDITADKVTTFALEKYGHLTPASVKRFFYTPLNAALRKGTRAHNLPPISFEAPKVERKTVEYAPRGWFPEFFNAAHFRIAAAVFFLTTTGARVSEMCNLTIGDLMLDHEGGPRALLRKTKNGKPRVVVLDPVLVKAIQRLVAIDGETALEKSVFGY
ncbi:tyrosine-type recombinase/integrase, partial [Hyphomicrobium sp.]|uniref:tyrosine-type recombinase/integrase n=1 Tax=Hyphomicrobium sp. TaxID=82 RepID=UPI001DF94A51